MSNDNKPLLGNLELVSEDEERIARTLREMNLQHVNDISEAVHTRRTVYSRYIKRILDLIISLPFFLVLLPLNVFFAICTYFDVGRPILYKQTRVGKNGKYFTIAKFRNMKNRTVRGSRQLPPSQRVTKFGRFMRKYSLDELLNIWFVVKGDMSIIGPRPYPVFIVDRMSERHKQRNRVKPGLECPRVIHVPGEEFYKYHRTFENDIWYVENVSFLTDVKMLFMLVRMVFSLKKREGQASGQGVSYFVGYDEDGYALSLLNYKRKYGDTEKYGQ